MRLAFARPRAVVALWCLTVVACALIGRGLFADLVDGGVYVRGGSAEHAEQVLAHAFPRQNGTSFAVAVHARGDAATRGWPRAAVGIVRARLANRPDVGGVALVAAAREGGRRLAIVSLRLHASFARAEQLVPALRLRIERPGRGLRLRLLGAPVVSHRYAETARSDLVRAEALALPLTLAILVLAFVSVTAAMLPLVLAGATVAVTFALLEAFAQLHPLSVFVTNTSVVLALGLSIDFSLFVVSRFREERHTTSSADAVRRTMATAGRAVAFSGLTVATALVSLACVGVQIFDSMAIGATVAALVAVLSATTLLPALLLLLGPRIDWLGVPAVARAARRATLWHRIGRAVTKRPLAAAVASGTCLLALASPLTSLSLSVHTTDGLSRHDPVRVEAHRLADVFGLGSVEPIELVTQAPPAAVERLVRTDPDVGQLWRGAEGRAGWHALYATLAPEVDSSRAQSAVRRLQARLATLPQRTYVGGESASGVELVERIRRRAPLVVGTAMALGAIVLVIALRSLVLPLKAVISTLLSVGAALGVVLALVPDGAGQRDLEVLTPLLVFALVFGVSMDYEVLLLSRIREEALGGSSTRDAVRVGLARSARSITLAGLTLALVFGALATSSLAVFRQIGVGVVVAVLLDVTLVRAVLVPAIVVLLGRWNWWLPRRRRRAPTSETEIQPEAP